MTYTGVFLFSMACTFSAAANAIFQVPEALSSGVEGNPGTQVCIRQRFLPSISDLFGQLVDTELPKINPPDTTVKLPVANHGSVIVQKMKFASFSSAKKHSLSLAPPNQTEWISTGLDYNISGQFRSTLQQLFSSTQTSGSVSLAAKNATIVLRTQIHATKEGKQRLEMVSCKANFTNASVSTQASGFFGALSKFFQGIVSSASATLLEHITCNTARYYIESVLNDVFAHELSTSVSVSESTRARSLLPPQLIYNYGLIRDTRVYKNCISMQEVGEVSWENKGGTPFHPPRLNYSTKRLNDHMLDIWVSDYAFNSLLFHANSHGVFDSVLLAPQWAPNLQSQCANASIADCIGNALPELANANDFPRQIVEMQLRPSNATVSPYVLFREDLPTSMVAELVVDLFISDTKQHRKNALTADVHLESDIRNVKLNSASILSAEATKTNATLKIKQDQLFLIPSVKEARSTTLGLFTASLIEKILNSKLSAGIPLPNLKGLKLVKADAVTFNRTMNIAANVELDQAYWSNAASQARIRVQKKES